jgi:hypothetical protein
VFFFVEDIFADAQDPAVVEERGGFVRRMSSPLECADTRLANELSRPSSRLFERYSSLRGCLRRIDPTQHRSEGNSRP